MKSMRRAGWCVVAVLVCASTASACPFCESETGQQVKAGIFNDHFWSNVLLTVLPFPILLAIVALIYFDVSWPWKQAHARAEAAGPSTAPTTTGE